MKPYKVRIYGQDWKTRMVKRFWFLKQARRWRDQQKAKGYGSLLYHWGQVREVTGPVRGVPGGVSVKLKKNQFQSF